MKLSFDGKGINGGDEYMSRIATFTEHGHSLNIGPLLAAAPELLDALDGVLRMLELLNAPGTHDPIEARIYQARAAISKALGGKK